MLNQEQKNIDLVIDLILNRVIRKTNTEEGILKAVHRYSDLSRSESKEFMDRYIGTHWNLRQADNGVNMYVLIPLSNLGGMQ
jgi:hypothetical protein